MAIPFLACMLLVAKVYALPPRVLPSIRVVEGGAVGSVSPNTDGSYDLGVMQVNTLWIRPLAQFAHLPPAEVSRRLIGDACFNIAAAGVILRTYVNEEHGNLMRAIGDYHSHTPGRNNQYQVKVTAAAMDLFAGGAHAAAGPPTQEAAPGVRTPPFRDR